MNSFELSFCISKVIVLVHLSVDIKHFLASVDAEVINTHVLAVKERWKELASDAVRVFSVEAAELFSVLA